MSAEKSIESRSRKAFENSLDPKDFFASAAHVEALSRILFVIEENRRCAALCGAAGIGKSYLLRVAARELSRTQRLVITLDLSGFDKSEFLWNLAAALRLGPKDGECTGRLWRMVEDYLRGMQHSGRQQVFLFDNVDRAEADCLVAVERVLEIGSFEDCRVSAVLALRSLHRTQSSFVDVCALRIELDAFTELETSRYIAARLTAAGCDANLFNDKSLAEIFKHSSGIPRDINRLCELSIHHAAHSGLQSIDEATVRLVAGDSSDNDDESFGLPLLYDLL